MKLVRVTKPLQAWSDFSRIKPEVLEYAAARGTMVHSMCAAILKGLFVPVIPEADGYIQSFTIWRDQYVDRVYFIEEEMIDEKLGIVGHPDAGVQLKDGRNVVPDWKTPAIVSKTWPLQTAAYLHLAKLKYPDVKWDGPMALQLRQNGSAAKATVYENSDRDFALYLQALNLHRYFNSEGEL